MRDICEKIILETNQIRVENQQVITSKSDTVHLVVDFYFENDHTDMMCQRVKLDHEHVIAIAGDHLQQSQSLTDTQLQHCLMNGDVEIEEQDILEALKQWANVELSEAVFIDHYNLDCAPSNQSLKDIFREIHENYYKVEQTRHNLEQNKLVRKHSTAWESGVSFQKEL